MFTEILKIKPKLDNASAKQAEISLSKRFSRVSKKFGAGLKNVIKGNILFMSLGMIAGMLNPLKDVEERFRALMGEGNDLRESADLAGTTPAKMQVLRDSAYVTGNISPDKLDGMLKSFMTAVEKAREEKLIADKTGAKLSEESSYVKDWLDRSDMAESFSEFLQSLKPLGQKIDGKNAYDLSEMELRNKVEKSVLGEIQKGGAKRFIDTDYNEAYSSVGSQSPDAINKATENITKQALIDRLLESNRKRNDFINMGGQLNTSRVLDMQTRQEIDDKKLLDQAKAFETLSGMASGLNEILDIMKVFIDVVSEGFGHIGSLLKAMNLSRAVRGVVNSVTGKE